MDNKLSELKRRAEKCPIRRFKAFIGKANTQATLCADTGIEIIGWSGFDASDLNAKSHRVELARFIAAADPETILALLAELEAKDERIGELEVIATEYAGKFQKAQDANKHLIIMSNDDKKRIAELEAHNECLLKKNADLTQQNIKLGERLATPVRLPNKNDDEFWFDNVFQVAKFDRAVERAIRAAGFTVEGDE
ncbi:Uncharacterised protein [Serratia marcescens]|uniref:ead/Ea22-like family protein n=1 Tax=Serratia marcescens TaxID=615 RepID=UPI000744F4BF|nr:ead/Ea22-like family protein [Serratia marcescens]CUZ08723.1 Uncharacterised protein [Serratia marcescens]CUZ34312.1 Uncharacterised protein [Serratia marcescens]CUZ34812.1 Uncharacterised protein [Serratia marcescens]CUZ36318.1 Uncharacterised protein [Serratia marcescens]CVA05099.1 Uncharacterised protein [Serratia marcescens]